MANITANPASFPATLSQDASRRARFLRDLAFGKLTRARLVAEADAHGADLDHEYFAVRATGSDRELRNLQAHLSQVGGTRARPVISHTEGGRLMALTSRRPCAALGMTIALGAPRRLGEIHHSFAEAEDVLDAARAFALTGVVDLVAIGPLTLVTAGDRLARGLAEHYLGDRGMGFAVIAETVRRLLDNDLDIVETAAEMHVHRNTVRYRVLRFQELTGLDVHRTSDMVTAWWLLKWRTLHQR